MNRMVIMIATVLASSLPVIAQSNEAPAQIQPVNPEVRIRVFPRYGGNLQPRKSALTAGGKRQEITIQEYPNDQIRTYKPGMMVCVTRYANFSRPFVADEQLEKTGPVGQKLVIALLAIPGVTEVNLEPWTIGIKVGKAFAWSTLEPQILETLGNVLLTGGTTIRYTEPRDLKIVVEELPNKLVRVFNLNQVIGDDGHAMFFFPLDKESRDFKNVGLRGQALVERLFEKNDTIDYITLKPYEVDILLFDGCKWTPELEAKVKEAIKAAVLTPVPSKPNNSPPRSRKRPNSALLPRLIREI